MIIKPKTVNGPWNHIKEPKFGVTGKLQRNKVHFWHSFDCKSAPALFGFHCVDTVGEYVPCLGFNSPGSLHGGNPRQRSQLRPDGRRCSDSGQSLWWRLASWTVCLLSVPYILYIMSNWSQVCEHKGKVNNVKWSVGSKDLAWFQSLLKECFFSKQACNPLFCTHAQLLSISCGGINKTIAASGSVVSLKTWFMIECLEMQSGCDKL